MLGYQVRCVKRQRTRDEDSFIVPYQGIANLESFTPEIIVNLANYYEQDSEADMKAMEDSIIGVATAVALENVKWKAKIIQTSSYFQYCPKAMRPWSRYAEFKSKALRIFEESCKLNKTALTNFIIYDIYGGKNKNKFLDLLIESTSTGNTLQATPGEQVINLTDISNIVSAIVFECSLTNIDRPKLIVNYDLRSNFTTTLLNLSQLVSTVLQVEPNVAWGSKPYRSKEVFNLWKSEFDPPDYWKPYDDLESYILSQAKLYGLAIDI
jgi:hypothetical protein